MNNNGYYQYEEEEVDPNAWDFDFIFGLIGAFAVFGVVLASKFNLI